MALHCDIYTFKYPQGWQLNNFAGQPGNLSHITWNLIQKHILNFISFPVCKMGAAEWEPHSITFAWLAFRAIRLHLSLWAFQILWDVRDLWFVSDQKMYVTVFTTMQ